MSFTLLVQLDNRRNKTLLNSTIDWARSTLDDVVSFNSRIEVKRCRSTQLSTWHAVFQLDDGSGTTSIYLTFDITRRLSTIDATHCITSLSTRRSTWHDFVQLDDRPGTMFNGFILSLTTESSTSLCMFQCTCSMHTVTVFPAVTYRQL